MGIVAVTVRVDHVQKSLQTLDGCAAWICRTFRFGMNLRIRHRLWRCHKVPGDGGASSATFSALAVGSTAGG